MLETAQTALLPALNVARATPTQTSPNGLRYGSYGDTELAATDLEQIVQAVPNSVAAALDRKAYYFVPLTMAEPDVDSGNPDGDSDADGIMIASRFSTELSDAAVCHRNSTVDGVECLFISSRLMQDRFALSFELYINIGHQFVDIAGVPQAFMDLVWSQAEASVRGETSQDAWESRAAATGQTGKDLSSPPSISSPREFANSSQRQRRIRLPDLKIKQNNSTTPTPALVQRMIDEKARTDYFHAAFADAIAIYLLSLTVDFDYTELREREYPLLAAPALAERLRHVAQLFPPNPGNEFSIRYRRRNG